MKKYIEITADHNDGDYLTNRNAITDEELKEYLPLIKEIKECGGSWEIGDCAEETLREQYPEFDESLLDNFNFYVPSGEYGVHTITDIVILEVVNETKLL